MAGTKSSRVLTDEDAVADATETVNQLREDFRDRDNLISLTQSVIFRERGVYIPEAYRKTAIEVHSPLPAHIANTITAALSINPPAVQFDPVGFGTSYQQNSTLREHFFDAAWHRQEQEAKRRLFRLFMYSLVTKGEAILKTVERTKTAWGDYGKLSKELKAELDADTLLDQDAKDLAYDAKTEEYKRAAPYPIVTTDVLPETFYYLKGEQGFTFCSEVKSIPYLDAFERYQGFGLNAKGEVVPEAMALPRAQWSDAMGSKGRSLQMIEAWDYKTVNYILLGPGQVASQSGGKLARGQLVRSVKHGYGDPFTKTLRGPYFHCLGVTTSERAPGRSGLGVLFAYLDLFPLLDSLLTLQSNSAYLTGFPAYKRTTPPGTGLPPAGFGSDGSEEDGAREAIEPGTVYPYDIEPIAQPTSGQDLAKMIGLARELLASALPPTIQGGVEGDPSGYALNQAAHLASLMWDPIVDNAEFTLADQVGFHSWLIEKRIAETVYAWGEQLPKKQGARGGSSGGWLGLGPKDINGIHRYKVRLNPQTPSNKVIEVRTHTEMLGARLESWDDAVTDLGGNPDEVETAWLLQDLKQDPTIKNQLTERTFDKLATIDQKKLGGQQAVDQALQQTVTPGGGGAIAGEPGTPGQPPVAPTPGQGMPLIPTPSGGAPVGEPSSPLPPMPPPGMAPLPSR